MSGAARTYGSGDRRLTLRRVVALTGVLAAVSGLAALLGAAYLWPLFFFPLVLGAAFFFELGSLAVTFWLGNFFVLSYSFRGPATPEEIRQALLGTALFLLAGLLLGALQRRNHSAQERLAASSLTDRQDKTAEPHTSTSSGRDEKGRHKAPPSVVNRSLREISE